MGAPVDYTGSSIMTFKIIGRNGTSPQGYALWKGKCKLCGAERDFRSSQIKHGSAMPCSCVVKDRQEKTKQWYKDNDYTVLLKDYLVKKVHNSWHLSKNNLPPEIDISKTNYENLKGEKINGIKILYPCGYNADRRIMYVCQCFCGEYFIAAGKSLRRGNTQSCDCLRQERVVQANFERAEDIVGKRFGRLKVLKFIGFSEPDQHNKRNSLYECQCKCGRTCIKYGRYLRCGDTQTCGLCLKSHGEVAIANYLDDKNIEYITQYNFDDCRNDITNSLLYFDFAILDKEKNIACLIEFDGEQHYNPKMQGWLTGTYEDLHHRDLIKDKYCQDNNYRLYRIRFDEDLILRLEGIINEL